MDLCNKLNINVENVIYVNDGWNYGRIEQSTIRFHNTTQFINEIDNMMIKFDSMELICKMPIDFDLLKTYGNDSKKICMEPNNFNGNISSNRFTFM
jgi:hypothetical protein